MYLQIRLREVGEKLNNRGVCKGGGGGFLGTVSEGEGLLGSMKLSSSSLTLTGQGTLGPKTLAPHILPVG